MKEFNQDFANTKIWVGESNMLTRSDLSQLLTANGCRWQDNSMSLWDELGFLRLSWVLGLYIEGDGQITICDDNDRRRFNKNKNREIKISDLLE